MCTTTYTNQHTPPPQQMQICCNRSQPQSHVLLSCSDVASTELMFLCSVHACSPPQDMLIKVSAAVLCLPQDQLSEKIRSLVNLFQHNSLAKQRKLGMARCLLLYSWKAGHHFVEGWGRGREWERKETLGGY